MVKKQIYQMAVSETMDLLDISEEKMFKCKSDDSVIARTILFVVLDELGFSCAYLSEKSGVPVSTINRLINNFNISGSYDLSHLTRIVRDKLLKALSSI